jgi:hypothetical protein
MVASAAMAMAALSHGTGTGGMPLIASAAAAWMT